MRHALKRLETVFTRGAGYLGRKLKVIGMSSQRNFRYPCGLLALDPIGVEELGSAPMARSR